MRYAIWTGLLMLGGVGLLVASCEDVTQDCALNPAILCLGETRGVAGSGGSTLSGTGGTAGCSSDAACPNDMDPCTRPACVAGECKTVADPEAEGMPCSGTGTPKCSMGECVGCMSDFDCQVAPCKVYTCVNQKCEPKNQVNDAELGKLQVPGDCHQVNCMDGAPQMPGVVDVGDKPDPMGDTNLCHQWGCTIDGTPLTGNPLAGGADCVPSVCGLSGDGTYSVQTVRVCASDQCQPAATTSCGGYSCDATTNKCMTSCALEADCFSHYYCDTGTAKCMAHKPLGASCTDKKECESDTCADGVCCNSSCANPCDACNVANFIGECSNLPIYAMSSACNGTNSCDGTGACKKGSGQPCATNAECTTGFCTDRIGNFGICCDSFCTGPGCNSCKPDGTCSLVNNGEACNKNNDTAGICNSNICN